MLTKYNYSDSDSDPIDIFEIWNFFRGPIFLHMTRCTLLSLSCHPLQLGLQTNGCASILWVQKSQLVLDASGVLLKDTIYVGWKRDVDVSLLLA